MKEMQNKESPAFYYVIISKANCRLHNFSSFLFYLYHTSVVTQKIERIKCTNKIFKTNNYNVLNVEQFLNFQQKSKNFMQKKVIHPQRDVLNAVQDAKRKTITEVVIEKEDTNSILE